RDVAARLVTLDVRPSKPKRHAVDSDAEREAERLEAQAAEHPCASCPDLAEHERWALRASKLRERIERAERHIRTRTETVAVQFDRVLEVLDQLEYVDGFSIRPKGAMLARIYGESDILVTEALSEQLFEGLSPSETAMAPGDFVRNCKQLIDLLRQIGDVAPEPASEAVRAARNAIDRGVVAYTGV